MSPHPPHFDPDGTVVPDGNADKATPAPLRRAVAPGKARLPPLRPGVVLRPRLQERLALLDAPGGPDTGLLSAPAGSGKSIVALRWLHGRSGPVVWLALDEGDREPRRFHAHLAAALRAAGRGALEAAAEVAERLARHGGDPRHELHDTLMALPSEIVIALDDLHLLGDSPPAREVGRWVGEEGRGPRLLLLSRTDPAVPLGRLRVSGTLLEIRDRDLRFGRGEAGELLAEALGREVDPELVAILESRTEGWAAGLRMAASLLRGADDDAQAVAGFSGHHRLMADYLVEETLAGLDPQLRRTLVETSILPRFTPEGCTRVTGDPEAATHIRQAFADNLFVIALDAGESWFRFHHLFAELLTHRLATRDPERHDALRLNASRWFEDLGDEEAALAQAAAMADPSRLLELLDRHGYPILARSEFASYARWASKAPDPLSPAARAWPMFLVAEAWFRAQTERGSRVGPLLDGIARAADDPPAHYTVEQARHLRHQLGALRAFTLRIDDRLHEAIEAGDAVLASLPDNARAMRGVVAFNSGAARLRLLDMPGARRDLESGYELCLASGIHYLVLASLGHLGNLVAHTEGVVPARQHLEGAVAFAEAHGISGVPAFAIVLYQLAHAHLLALDLGPARQILERARKLVSGERDTDIQANVLLHLARLEALEGDATAARDRLAEAAALAHGHMVKPFATTLEVERAHLAALCEDRLWQPSPEVGAAADDDLWTSPREAESQLALQHAVRLGHRARAEALAERLESESRSRNRGVAWVVARLAQACLAQDPAARENHATAALERGMRGGYVAPFVYGGPPVRELISELLSSPLGAREAAWLRSEVLPHLLPPASAGSGTAAAPGPEGDPSRDTDLTDREVEVLAAVARGRTNAEVADELFVSLNTVKTHLKHVYAKLDVTNRTEAVRVAQLEGLLPGAGRGPGSRVKDHPEDHPNG